MVYRISYIKLYNIILFLSEVYQLFIFMINFTIFTIHDSQNITYYDFIGTLNWSRI